MLRRGRTLEDASEVRTRLAVMGAEGDLDEADYRSGLRRIKARANEARDRLEAAGAGVDASESPSDVWKKLEEGGKYLSDQTWDFVPRRVMQ